MKIIFLLSALTFSVAGFSSQAEYYCTKWAKRDLTCVFASKSADVWARQCENPCTPRNWGPQCDLTEMCYSGDPNELSSACSAWIKDRSSNCPNPATGRFEQKWIRVCQTGLATIWCSDEDPNRH